MRNARLRMWLTALLLMLLGYLIGRVQPFIARAPLVIGQDAISNDASSAAKVSLDSVGGRVINIQPASGQADTLLIYYPGGLVRPQAYEWLGRALSGHGIQTVIPEFPLDLGVIQPGRADALIKQYGQGKRVVIAGHSLGGAMAAQYASKHAEQLAGLILMASYPAGNVSLKEVKFPVLSLLAERDGVARPEAVRDGLKRLPSGTALRVIPGAVHSFFGRYGPQKGDGQPTVDRASAEAEILRQVNIFLHALPVADAQR